VDFKATQAGTITVWAVNGSLVKFDGKNQTGTKFANGKNYVVKVKAGSIITVSGVKKAAGKEMVSTAGYSK
jgi:hypothetical protein